MLQLLTITIILIGLCYLALGVRIWFKGKFADTEVGHNPHMRKLGLRCAREEELELWKKNDDNHPQSVLNCGSCAACRSNSDCAVLD